MDIPHKSALEIIEAYAETLVTYWGDGKEVSYARWTVKELRHIVQTEAFTPPLIAIEAFKDKVCAYASRCNDKRIIFNTAYDTVQSIIDCFAE